MDGCPRKEPKTKTRKLCEAAGVSKPAFCYNNGNSSQELKDKEILGLPLRLPKQVLKRRGSKAKTREIKIRFGKAVNHKRAARICRENGLLAANRRRKFPKDYYRAICSFTTLICSSVKLKNFFMRKTICVRLLPSLHDHTISLKLRICKQSDTNRAKIARGYINARIKKTK